METAQAKMAEALVFLQRIVRAHVARERHLVLLQQKRRQDAFVAKFIVEVEVRCIGC